MLGDSPVLHLLPLHCCHKRIAILLGFYFSFEVSGTHGFKAVHNHSQEALKVLPVAVFHCLQILALHEAILWDMDAMLPEAVNGEHGSFQHE